MVARGPKPQAPAFNDEALAAARQQARAAWEVESVKERDRLLALPPAERLAALDDEEVRSVLMPSHRAELRASITTASPAPATAAGVEDHAAAMAAWRERDAAAQEALRRKERDRRGWVFTAALLAVMVVVLLVVWLRG